jgi:hypothetical protein
VQLGAARALLGAAVPRDHGGVGRFTDKDLQDIAALFYDTLAKFIPEERRWMAQTTLNAVLERKAGG